MLNSKIIWFLTIRDVRRHLASHHDKTLDDANLNELADILDDTLDTCFATTITEFINKMENQNGQTNS